jgi:hypothetical protein
MAAPKTTAVFSPAFSTILTDLRIDQVHAVLDRTEQDPQFTRTHGMSRKDWDAALSLHLHRDLR